MFGWNLSIKKKPGDDGSNILTQYNRIPDWWSRPGQTEEQNKTRTKLHEQRRKERVPHISYDLDNDGYVGGKDYVVAKQFDKDGDGKLDAEERKAAMEALKNVRMLLDDDDIDAFLAAGVFSMILRLRQVCCHLSNSCML